MTAVLLERWNAIYVEVPKVACSSIKLALAHLLGIDVEAAGGDPHAIALPAPAPRAQEPGPLHPERFAFAFVRNPWDRLVSCHRDKILGEVPSFTRFDPSRGVACCLARFPAFEADMPFDAFVQAVAAIPDEDADEHFRSQHTFVTDAAGRIALDFVGRFESLAADFEQVRAQLGMPPVALPHVQAAPTRERYVERYSRRTRELVARRFQRDIELFGYAFGAARGATQALRPERPGDANR